MMNHLNAHLRRLVSLRYWRRVARVTFFAEERGSATIMSTALAVVALVVILPMVWNLGAVRVVRRQSQNGSDAAAQAAAEQVARTLNRASQDIWGCIPPMTRPLIVQKYVNTVVAGIASSQNGAGSAADYASQNYSTVTDYSQHLHRMSADGVHAKMVTGAVVPPVHVDALVTAQVKGLIASTMDDLEGYPVPARASGEAYLHTYRTWTTPCPYNPKYAKAVHYKFTWRIRIVKPGW